MAVLGWGLVAHLVRPDVFDDASTATYVVMGSMLTFGAVLLVGQYQALLLFPLRPVMNRPSETALATRLAIAYPTAKRFRTGATLGMYCIVVFVIVLLTQISAIIDAGVDDAVDEASGGWTLRADFNPTAPWRDAERAVTTGPFAGRVAEAATLMTAPATGDDPLGRTTDDVPVLAIGVPDGLGATPFVLDERLAAMPDDAATWRLVLNHPSYVIIDSFYGATGGPQGKRIAPGDVLTLTDPQTGRKVPRTVAGLLPSGITFYGLSPGEFRNPVLMGQFAIRQVFGEQARPSSLLLRLTPGTDPAPVASELQGEFLHNGLVATDIRQAVRDNFAANQQFFTLMRGYLALGLLVGVAGLGVVMVKSVRERRRTIAVLRALGFQARTVRRSILGESTFVAVEGVTVGTVLGVLTTWLLYQNSPAFGNLSAAFPIAWGQIALTVGATLAASLLATVGPARRAAQIRPAVALRIAD
jgi:putative ABC transport system permease protein